MENRKFDYEALKKEAAKCLKKSGSMLGKDGVFTPLSGMFPLPVLGDFYATCKPFFT
ncbi:MAG: hypothetical protein KBA16_06365 [Bacteroidia bacterium]|jgi:hypothetical protein|nr:hypothetical protein [Bacteroidia bacterium]MBP7437326.1 hypothetical protein [Bacteroidia bacterium]MBP7728513.1 hypothetical protein [Bacteroidia bacterium]MBP7772440.1 hypothetical protein [Bacteroidia bacterium]